MAKARNIIGELSYATPYEPIINYTNFNPTIDHLEREQEKAQTAGAAMQATMKALPVDMSNKMEYESMFSGVDDIISDSSLHPSEKVSAVKRKAAQAAKLLTDVNNPYYHTEKNFERKTNIDAAIDKRQADQEITTQDAIIAKGLTLYNYNKVGAGNHVMMGDKKYFMPNNIEEIHNLYNPPNIIDKGKLATEASANTAKSIILENGENAIVTKQNEDGEMVQYIHPEAFKRSQYSTVYSKNGYINKDDAKFFGITPDRVLWATATRLVSQTEFAEREKWEGQQTIANDNRFWEDIEKRIGLKIPFEERFTILRGGKTDLDLTEGELSVLDRSVKDYVTSSALLQAQIESTKLSTLDAEVDRTKVMDGVWKAKYERANELADRKEEVLVPINVPFNNALNIESTLDDKILSLKNELLILEKGKGKDILGVKSQKEWDESIANITKQINFWDNIKTLDFKKPESKKLFLKSVNGIGINNGSIEYEILKGVVNGENIQTAEQALFNYNNVIKEYTDDYATTNLHLTVPTSDADRAADVIKYWGDKKSSSFGEAASRSIYVDGKYVGGYKQMLKELGYSENEILKFKEKSYPALLGSQGGDNPFKASITAFNIADDKGRQHTIVLGGTSVQETTTNDNLHALASFEFNPFQKEGRPAIFKKSDINPTDYPENTPKGDALIAFTPTRTMYFVNPENPSEISKTYKKGFKLKSEIQLMEKGVDKPHPPTQFEYIKVIAASKAIQFANQAGKTKEGFRSVYKPYTIEQ